MLDQNDTVEVRRSWVSSLTIFRRPRSARSMRTAGLTLATELRQALIFFIEDTWQFCERSGVGVASAARKVSVWHAL